MRSSASVNGSCLGKCKAGEMRRGPSTDRLRDGGGVAVRANKRPLACEILKKRAKMRNLRQLERNRQSLIRLR